METVNDSNCIDLKPGAEIHGYVVKRVHYLKELEACFYELTHSQSGATHIHIQNDDKENTFGVVFKTVPKDSTGVAHILEHTVLCGSKKYPVRDPFFSMIKRSLNTFMNAFTSSDWTMYPFATQNEKDFYNLLSVYLDAAFFPNIDELSFKQEGHRLEKEPANDKDDYDLVYKGVVYNEMKGAMSSPDQVMVRSILNALYPSTTYSNNSGGDPANIPQLTHEQLVSFHKHHYHPSNAFFYTYGNLKLEKHLQFIAENVLRHFEKIDPHTDVASHPRWKKGKTVTYTYPLSEAEDPAKKSQVCVAWMLADIRDSFEILVLTLLENVLLGNSASPLRKALIDSELGSALCDGTGFDADFKDTMFVCGLKGIHQDDASKVEKIIFDLFEDLVQNGIDQQLVDAAIHQIEFHRKERTNRPYPYGLKLLLGLTGSWIHHGDPVEILEFSTIIEKLRECLKDPDFLKNRIKAHFLQNPHRVRLLMVPDQKKEVTENQRVKEELLKLKASLTPEQIQKIDQDTEQLKLLQESEEDISSLPTLELSDIPPSVKIITETDIKLDIPATCYQQPTSDIVYFSSVMGLGGLGADLLPLVPFFCYAFTRTGTRKWDYVELARQIDLYTGGIATSASGRTQFDQNGESMPLLIFNGKCLGRNQERMFEILIELLSQSDFSNIVRLKSLLLEYKAALESSIVHNGHRLAISLASRNFSKTFLVNEMWHGVEQIKTIKKLADDPNDDILKKLSGDLKRIADSILIQNNIKIALIGENTVFEPAVAQINALKQSLGQSGSTGFIAPGIEPAQNRINEGWSTSTSVSFVARCFQTVRMTHPDAPVLAVISKLLRSLYLHREIREKGGAYGGFALYNLEDGLFSFGSYRDPHVVNTLSVYENALGFIRSGDYTAEDVKEAVLQVCSDIDKPDPPGPSSRKAFMRKMISLSDDMRIKFKKDLLTLTKEQIIDVATRYFDPDKHTAGIAVISSQAKLEEANSKLTNNPLTLNRI